MGEIGLKQTFIISTYYSVIEFKEIQFNQVIVNVIVICYSYFFFLNGRVKTTIICTYHNILIDGKYCLKLPIGDPNSHACHYLQWLLSLIATNHIFPSQQELCCM